MNYFLIVFNVFLSYDYKIYLLLVDCKIKMKNMGVVEPKKFRFITSPPFPPFQKGLHQALQCPPKFKIFFYNDQKST
jgi:hypothetical protein